MIHQSCCSVYNGSKYIFSIEILVCCTICKNTHKELKTVQLKKGIVSTACLIKSHQHVFNLPCNSSSHTEKENCDPSRVEQKLPSRQTVMSQSLLNVACAFKSTMSRSTCLFSEPHMCLLASVVLSAEWSKDIFSFTSMGLEEAIPSSYSHLRAQKIKRTYQRRERRSE